MVSHLPRASHGHQSQAWPPPPPCPLLNWQPNPQAPSTSLTSFSGKPQLIGHSKSERLCDDSPTPSRGAPGPKIQPSQHDVMATLALAGRKSMEGVCLELAAQYPVGSHASCCEFHLGQTLARSRDRQWFIWLSINNRCWTAYHLAKGGLPHLAACPFVTRWMNQSNLC